jgi:fructuronate reductase
MVTLNRSSLKYPQTREAWAKAGVTLPSFDLDAMLRKTKEAPRWVHFGTGNIFRGYIARLQQDLLELGLAETGIIAVAPYDTEVVERIYVPHDNLSLLVSLYPYGRMERRIIASVAEALRTDREADRMALRRIFASPSLQMASFSITEKGYAIRDIRGEYLEQVKADVANGPEQSRHAMGIVASLLFERYRRGAFPIALVSMDNFRANGDKLKGAVCEIAEHWAERGFVPQGFIDYLNDCGRLSFPWSMIDKIVPRPSEKVAQELTALGIADMKPIITGKNTYIAPFVNAEVPEYLVVEDSFPAGRPALERAGVFFVDRSTVDKAERMKVATCLNPLHTALAIFGCLLGYDSIAREMADPDLVLLVKKIGYDEGLPVVADPGIIDPKSFLDEVINVRFANPFVLDSPQRIATDTSQKIPVRFGHTIRAYMEGKGSSESKGASGLTFIPLVIAAWFRYLLGVDDSLLPMKVSPDPQLAYLQASLSGIEVGKPESYRGQLQKLLCNEALFSVDIRDAGLDDKIETMFKALITGKGAVRATLREYLGRKGNDRDSTGTTF